MTETIFWSWFIDSVFYVTQVASQSAQGDSDMTPKELLAARKKLELSPTEMARAMGVSYDTYKSWQNGRRSMPKVAIRCVELLLTYPKTARKLGHD